MAEFLRYFLPTAAFMLVPVAIPLVAVAVGTVSDLVRRDRKALTVADRARANLAQRESAQGDLAQAA